MRIDRTAAPRLASGTRVARRAAGFAVSEAPDTGEAAAAGGVAGVMGLLPAGALDGAEAAGGDAVRDDAAAAGQGRALLGALAGLQLAALGGGGVAARRTLADLARALPQATDPGLDAVLRAIAQRAAIELARES